VEEGALGRVDPDEGLPQGLRHEGPSMFTSRRTTTPPGVLHSYGEIDVLLEDLIRPYPEMKTRLHHQQTLKLMLRTERRSRHERTTYRCRTNTINLDTTSPIKA
jgi:hypothetical protein